MNNKIKTILFASLIAAMILPFSGMTMAEAAPNENASDNAKSTHKQKVEDSSMVNFLNELVVETGVTIKSKTLDSVKITITTDVQQLTDTKYKVHIVGTEDGKITNVQNIIITQNDDGSINMINGKMGHNVDFYEFNETQSETSDIISKLVDLLLPQVFAGSGSSNGSGARIDLYDSDYRSDGTTVINLDDSYIGCLGLNKGDFTASVYTSTTNVDWVGNLSYWDWCVNDHTFDRITVYHEGTLHTYTGASYRDSSDRYSHSGGPGNFSVDINMYYGSW